MLTKTRCGWLAIGVAAPSLFLALWTGGAIWAHPQSSQGPAQQPGETVIVPKPHQNSSQQQGPVQQPGEIVLPKKNNLPPVAAPKKPEKINPSQVYTLSTTTNLVNLNVLVEDGSGDPIKNLQKDNFRIYDDGVQQTVTNFAAVQSPMTVCMVVEFSNEYWPLLYQALESAYSFVNFMQPHDYVAVITFDLKPHILTDFTHDRNQVIGALQELQFPGFSEVDLYDALAFTIDRMKDVQGRKAILAIVSGFDTFSKLTYDQMLKIAKSSNTPVYPVSILEWLAVRMPGGYNINYWQARNALNYIAKYSGGQAYFPRFEGELPGIYQQIGEQLRSQYSLGYTPTNPEKDGKYHKLKVDLTDAQGNPLRIINQKGKQVKYHLVFREGYYAPRG
ncbi:MAG: VWA domain-containing protein [Acidobacteriota bacterium]|nr:VWA domain-containing protein [Acidobacteriota bacterium]